jgi:L-aspartate semialdehyde sulfurtransferase ferredoxin
MKQWWRLTYAPEQLKEPIIYLLIKQYDVVTNILRAQVERDRGWLALEIQGSEPALREARGWLAERGILVEETEDPATLDTWIR